MGKSLKLALCISLLVLPMGVMAQVRTIDGTDPVQIATALQGAGYKASPGKRDNGDPYIASAANGASFTIEFYGCEGEKACSSLQFYAWYKKEPFFSETLVNDWNKQKRFLKAYIDNDGDLGTTMDVSTLGPMGAENFEDVIDWWTVMSAELVSFLKERRQPVD